MNIKSDGIEIVFDKESRFKTNRIYIDFILPGNVFNHPAMKLFFEITSKGTEKYPKLSDLTEKAEDLYGAVFSFRNKCFGNVYVFTVCIEYLKNKYTEGNDLFDDVVDLFDQFIFHPYKVNGAFDVGRINTEKENLISKFNRIKNDSEIYSTYRSLEFIYRDSDRPVYEIGTADEISSVTPKDVNEAYNTLIKNSVIRINCIGEFVEDYSEKSLEGLFSDVNRSPVVIDKIPPFIPRERDAKIIDEIGDFKKGDICIGYTLNEEWDGFEDNLRFSLYMYVLSDSQLAKLFMNVREKKSLCYFIFTAKISVNNTFIIQAGINVSDFEMAKDAILKEVDDCINGNISDEELLAAKKSMLSEYISACDLMSFKHSSGLGKFLKIDDISEFEEKVSRLTKDDIRSVASKFKLDLIYFLHGKDNEKV